MSDTEKNMNNNEGQANQKNSHANDKKKNFKRYYRPKTNNIQNKNYNSLKNNKNSSISIVIPLFNEEESLEPLYKSIYDVVTRNKYNYEIIFVDDGSADRSLQIIKRLAYRDKNVKYISFRQNYGKSAALNEGFKIANGDIVITMDADLQDNPEEIPNLINKINEGYDIVSGWKKDRKDSFVKNQTSKIYNFVTRLVSGIKLHDMNCGLKAYRKDVVKSIEIYGEFHRYIPVLAKWHGFKKITEIPVKHQPRQYGVSKFGLSRFYKGFVDLITVTFITRYVTRPMHLFGLWGAIIAFIGFMIEFYLTYEKLIHNRGLENRPLLFLGILMILFGGQLFSTGLIGELIVHNSNKDKEYTIREKKVE